MNRPLKPGDRVFKIKGKTYHTKQMGTRPYYISRCGQIISDLRKTTRVLTGGKAMGYRGVSMFWNDKRIRVRHHVAVMHYWVGPRPPGMVINHKDGVKDNNRLENLEYCTPEENRRHARVNRFYSSGSGCSWAKLNESEAMLIRKAKEVGLSYNQIALAFEVDKASVVRICQNKTWTYAETDMAKGKDKAVDHDHSSWPIVGGSATLCPVPGCDFGITPLGRPSPVKPREWYIRLQPNDFGEDMGIWDCTEIKPQRPSKWIKVREVIEGDV